MSSVLKATAIVAMLGAGVPAHAAQLGIDLTMKSYYGTNAYVAAYVVDANGRYVSTLYVAGQREKYQADLGRWYRMFRRSRGVVDGTTGASIGPGGHVSFNVDIPDNMLNAGMTLRFETAVENQYYVQDEAAVALDDAHNGKPVSGTYFVESAGVRY